MGRVLILVFALTAIASTGSSAQRQDPDSAIFQGRLLLTQPDVIAGPDVGFRITGWNGKIPKGQVVVKVDGAWIAAEIE